MNDRPFRALTLLSLVLVAVSAGVALGNGSIDHPGAASALASLTVAALLGVGLYAWRRERQGRFGPLLYAAGLCWFVATLSNSDSSLVYSVGRIGGWVFEVVLVYALLSYPSGRLESRGARAVVASGALLVALLFLPTVPFSEEFPVPNPYAACGVDCPPNAFFGGSQPAVLDDVVRPLRETLNFVLYALAVWLFSARLWRAGRSRRRTLAPVLGAAVLRFAAASIYVALRRMQAGETAMEIAAVVAVVSIPATALGLLIGMLQWRIYSAGALATLTTQLDSARTTAQLQGLLATSLDEPDIALFTAPPNEPSRDEDVSWFDADGQPCGAPEATTDHHVSEAMSASGLRIAIVYDRDFGDYPDFGQAVASAVVSAMERHRLDAALAASLSDVEASRARLASAADEARHQIERDLHDGAQQQLVALRMKLALASDAIERDPANAADLVASLGPEVDEIIDEVRALARGIYPPLLASGGLEEALRAAGMRSPLPVTVSADGVGRRSPETESAVYFCCLEALQNAAKYAAGATGVAITLSDQAGLTFEVSDDGCGFTGGVTSGGSGITGMRDRLAAIGGELEIWSAPGAGTRVVGRLTGK